jgi:hypothetical protein
MPVGPPRSSGPLDGSAPESVCLTALVLDAVEMATGGDSLTFSRSDTFKKRLHTSKTRVAYERAAPMQSRIIFPG